MWRRYSGAIIKLVVLIFQIWNFYGYKFTLLIINIYWNALLLLADILDQIWQLRINYNSWRDPWFRSVTCRELYHLTQRSLLTHIYVNESGQHWFRQWLVACTAPSHYPNQSWFIVNWFFIDKLQWNFNQNTKPFIHENASENIVCENAAFLFRGRWDKSVTRCCRLYDSLVSTKTIILWCLQWTYSRKATPYGGIDLGQYGPRQWLLAWRHQAITWTNANLSSMGICGNHLIQYYISIRKMSLKNILLNYFYVSQWPKNSVRNGYSGEV